MRLFILCIFFFQSFVLVSQTSAEKLKSIFTIHDAEQYVSSHPEDNVLIFTMSPEIEGPDVVKEFSSRKVGDIFTQDENTFKIIDEADIQASRVSYVYLDGNKLSFPEINKLREQIVREYKQGKPFAELANKYTMDTNKNGDLGWFTEGTMVPIFGSSIQKHKLNDIFIVDIPENKWYYVVLKTFDSKKVKNLTVIRVKSST
jgi:hypothetical protein